MWKTNLKVMLVGLVTIGFYTFIAQIIPQLQSAVPQELDLSGDVTQDMLVAAGQEVFAGLINRFERIEPAGDRPYRRRLVLRGLETCPVTVTAR